MNSVRLRELVVHVQQETGQSERKTCGALERPRSTQRYIRRRRDDEEKLVAAIHEHVRKHPRHGYRLTWGYLRQEGWQVNAKRVYRLWRREGLKVPKKQRKRRRLGKSENGCSHYKPEHKDHVWAWDFVHDRTSSGSPLKWLSIVDEYTRESLALCVGRSMTAREVKDVLRELFLQRGFPKHIRSDNGPEFIAKLLRNWFSELDIDVLYIEPGSPWENGYAESFNSRFRDEILDREVFDSIRDARRLTAAWHQEYNERRPHSSLGYIPPSAYAAACATSATATPPLQRHKREETALTFN